MASRRLVRSQAGVTAVETALILPVLLFIVMMLFELARVALVVAVSHLALEQALQELRQTPAFYATPNLEQTLTQRTAHYAWGIIDASQISLQAQRFDSLLRFGGTPAEDDSEDDAARRPIISVDVSIEQTFMTPLPALFGLGDQYAYRYHQVLGNLTHQPEESPP
jgi:hypothetical protein